MSPGARFEDLMAAPGAPRCEDCAGDLEHPYDLKCSRCLKMAAAVILRAKKTRKNFTRGLDTPGRAC